MRDTGGVGDLRLQAVPGLTQKCGNIAGCTGIGGQHLDHRMRWQRMQSLLQA